MRITTWNVNGLRAAHKKGFLAQLSEVAPDVLLLQEVRAIPDQLPPEIREPDGWYVWWHPATRPGYSGTAIWSRKPFQITGTGLSGCDSDNEGRVIEATLGSLTIACIYLPSGSSGPHRQIVKDTFLTGFTKWASNRKAANPLILGGDLNVAHTASDIFYAKANEQTSGFLPHERAWMTSLLESGWHDLVREHFGDVQGPYSWWSNRGRARELDRGWRIDYLLANAAARPWFRSAMIHREAGLAISDHAPVSIDLDC